MLRFELALKANFNPSQPRVPAGRPSGGRWTRVGSPPGEGPAAPLRTSPAPSSAGSIDDGWTVVGRRTDGMVREETVVHRDGSAIRAEVSAAPLTTGWDERYTVIGTDGTILTFQNRGRHQQVFDSSASLIAESRWSPQGVTTEPTVQPAFLSLLLETVELGLTLFTWLSTRNTPERQAVIAFSAREFRPGAPPSLALDFVGTLSRDELEEACPRLGEVQMRTNDAVETVRRRGALDLSPTQFGTAVHVALKNQINSLDDPHFRAEVSALKSLDEKYGTRESIQIDVFENVGGGTVCVYDIKTGRAGLSFSRAREIAIKVLNSFGGATKIIVIEVRPSQ